MKRYTATIATLAEATVSDGIQNKVTLNGLVPNLLAAKKRAKKRIARIQNRNEKRLSMSPAQTTAIPVALLLPTPATAHQIPGRSSAKVIATIPLKMPFT